MLISKSWLADFVNLEATTEDICEQLTALGLEVERVSKAAPDFNGVVVGKVLSLDPHPDADKLQVASVDAGAEAPLQIVCGASNVVTDGLFPVATVGAVLPGDFKIKRSKLRGVESHGMLCSESELGLAEKSDGLMPLPNDFVVGQNIREALDLDDDIIEIGLTPNRGDCLSHLGVARELALAFKTILLPFDKAVQSLQMNDDVSPKVQLLAEQACPKYIARKLTGVNNLSQSPWWLVERLRRAGVRSLTPVVDVTNYVMLELGTPLHAFNAKAIEGDIIVRMADDSEPMTLLDGKEISLTDKMLVIADEQKPIALAGIMGGANSVIDESTQDIVLESAWFSPDAITGRARQINLHTDASHRYERGVDYQLQQQAIDRATQLILDICGGHACQETVAVNETALPQRSEINLRSTHVDAVLGLSFPQDQIAEILTNLGMCATVADPDRASVYQVTPPSYRFDISLEEDLIEELIRVWGYDNIPVASVSVECLQHSKTSVQRPCQQLHALMVNRGYHEAITYSFIDQALASEFSDTAQMISLLNPLSAELNVMRTSLLPSLVKGLSHNVKRQQNHVRLYEFGHGYYQTNDDILQTEKLAGVVTGDVYPMQWGFRERQIDFFDIKGDVEQILSSLGASSEVEYRRSERPFLHPGQSADIYYHNKCIGFVGALHPNAQKSVDIEPRVLAFELDISDLKPMGLTVAQSVSKYPEVRRDISVLMAQGHQSADIIAAIQSVDSDLLTSVCLFDVYIGRNIPRNTKSMTIAIYLQDTQATLTDEQADEIVEQVVAILSKQFNAELRG